MRQSTDYPPNYREILDAIPAVLNTKPIFCYGDTIYNPHGREITPDLELHEAVHTRQQGASPEAWWSRYLSDADFRLAQELEAYGEQFALVKRHMRGRLRDYALNSMAQALSGATYGHLLSHGEAVSKIRRYEAR